MIKHKWTHVLEFVIIIIPAYSSIDNILLSTLQITEIANLYIVRMIWILTFLVQIVGIRLKRIYYCFRLKPSVLRHL
jgi:hypothetical protein